MVLRTCVIIATSRSADSPQQHCFLHKLPCPPTRQSSQKGNGSRIMTVHCRETLCMHSIPCSLTATAARSGLGPHQVQRHLNTNSSAPAWSGISASILSGHSHTHPHHISLLGCFTFSRALWFCSPLPDVVGPHTPAGEGSFAGRFDMGTTWDGAPPG